MLTKEIWEDLLQKVKLVVIVRGKVTGDLRIDRHSKGWL